MGKMKKGIFFTFIAIIMMTIFILIFTPQIDSSLQKDAQSLNTRITTIDNYINDLQYNYLITVMKVTGKKTIESLIFYMNSTNSFLSGFDSAFQEVFMNGTINNVQIDSITGRKIMDNRTFTNWSSRISQISLDVFKVNTNITVQNASATQVTPWEIELILKINLSVKSNVAEWSKISTIKTSLPIEGLYDPLYLVNVNVIDSLSYGKKIKNAGLEPYQWNITQVRYHLRNDTYVYWASTNAPNYLSRFTNSFTMSSCCGIESLVNPNLVPTSDAMDSYVDYIFWNNADNTPCSQLYNITNPTTGGGIWDEFQYFKLDFEHLTKYNITSNDAVRAC
jgi:hypothetical protein